MEYKPELLNSLANAHGFDQGLKGLEITRLNELNRDLEFQVSVGRVQEDASMPLVPGIEVNECNPDTIDAALMNAVVADMGITSPAPRIAYPKTLVKVSSKYRSVGVNFASHQIPTPNQPK